MSQEKVSVNLNDLPGEEALKLIEQIFDKFIGGFSAFADSVSEELGNHIHSTVCEMRNLRDQHGASSVSNLGPKQPISCATRSHEDVRDECIRMIDYFLDRIYAEHERISGRTFDSVHAAYWVDSSREELKKITQELKEFESSDFVKLYLSRATDGGSGYRDNISKIYDALGKFRSQVNAADGIHEHSRSFTPGVRTQTTEVDVPVFRETSGVLGFGRRSEFVGMAHQKTVRTFKDGRQTTVQVYDRDCFGGPYRK